VGITTVEVLVGTPEGVQFAAVFQSVLTLPFQVAVPETDNDSVVVTAPPEFWA
jgi:hypothetical protein